MLHKKRVQIVYITLAILSLSCGITGCQKQSAERSELAVITEPESETLQSIREYANVTPERKTLQTKAEQEETAENVPVLAAEQDKADTLEGTYLAKLERGSKNTVAITILKEEMVNAAIADTLYPGATVTGESGTLYQIISLSDYIAMSQPMITDVNGNHVMTESDLEEYLRTKYSSPIPEVMCKWEENGATMYGTLTDQSFYGKFAGKSLYNDSSAVNHLPDGKYSICKFSTELGCLNETYASDAPVALTYTKSNNLEASKTYTVICGIKNGEITSLAIFQ